MRLEDLLNSGPGPPEFVDMDLSPDLGSPRLSLAREALRSIHLAFQYLPEHLYLMEVYSLYWSFVTPDPSQEHVIQMALLLATTPAQTAAVLSYGNRPELIELPGGITCANSVTHPLI